MIDTNIVSPHRAFEMALDGRRPDGGSPAGGQRRAVTDGLTLVVGVAAGAVALTACGVDQSVDLTVAALHVGL
jgi:small-conductance mechanosensitive channel